MHVHHLLVILVAMDGQPRDTVPLYTDLGDHHVPITTPVGVERDRITGRPSARSTMRSEEHTSELQSHSDLVCRLLLEKKKNVEGSGYTYQDTSHFQNLRLSDRVQLL